MLRQKSLGAGIMVSDFTDEVSGYVQLEDGSQEAWLYLETQKGYFNNDHLLQQVEHTIDVFEKIHQNAQGLFYLIMRHLIKSKQMILLTLRK